MRKTLLFIIISLFSASVYGQISNRLLVSQNNLQNVNPDNLVFTLPPTDNRFMVVNKNSIRFNFNQILFLTDSIKFIGDARYKGISWLPSWSDVSGKPNIFPSDISSVSGLQTALDGKQAVGSYLTTSYIPTWSSISGKPTFATVASSGLYSDLSGLPTIPTNNNQLTNGAGYLTAETDPIWTTDKTSYRTKVQNDGLYQPIGSYLTSETDPTVPTYAKGLSAFSVIKASTDVLYKGIGYSPSSGEIISALGYTPYNGTTNPNGYISSVPAQSFASLTGKPTTLSGYGITDAATSSALTSGLAAKQNLVSLTTTGSGAATFNQSTGALNIPTGTSYTAGTGIGISSGVITNTAPDQTVSISGGTSIGVSGTYPSFTINNNAPYVLPTINSATRSLNSNFTISATKQAQVAYTISLSVTNPLLVGTSSAAAYLEYSVNAGSTWVPVSDALISSGVGVAVAVAITNTQSQIVSGTIPANALVRIRTATSGTASLVYVRGQETY